MKRRDFIFDLTLSSVNLLFLSNLSSCSANNTLQLDKIIAQPESWLFKTIYFKKEGNTDFGYYLYNQNNFEHKVYNGKQAIVFYKNFKIIGYIIQIEGNDANNMYIKAISKLFGSYKINFENDFGKQYQWQNKEKSITLTYNNNSNLPKLSFYSEMLK